MRNNDFDFIKDKFDYCENDLPVDLETKSIEYKILTDRKHKTIKFRQKKNYKPLLRAVACFIIVICVVFAAALMNINSGKASTFADYDELNTTVEPLDKVITAGGRGGAMKTHKYVQTDGVENADVIKSDGEYIYYAAWNDIDNNSVYIYKSGENDNKPLAVIDDLCPDETAEGDLYDVRCIFVYHNRLVVNINKRNYILSEKYGRDLSTTITKIYDIADKSGPLLMSEFEQSGEYMSAKMIENILYVSTNYNVSDNHVLPWTKKGSETVYASPENIARFENAQVAQYAVISAYDVEAEKNAEQLKAVLGGDADIKCTKDSIYITVYPQYTPDGELIQNDDQKIIKLDLKKMKFLYADKEEIRQLSADVEINRDEAFSGVVYDIGDMFLCIGEDLNTVDNEMILYDKNMTELDSMVLDSMQLLSLKLFMNEDTGEFVLPVYSADSEQRYYGIAVFRINNNKIEMTNSFFNDDLLINGNYHFIMTGDEFYCIGEDEKLYSFNYR